jgi:hypothetical protein
MLTQHHDLLDKAESVGSVRDELWACRLREEAVHISRADAVEGLQADTD